MDLLERVKYVFEQTSVYGTLIAVYYIGLLYIWVSDKEKEYRTRILYPSVLLILLLLNPFLMKYIWIKLFYGDAELIMTARIFAFLPVVFVIAFLFSRLLQEAEDVKKKIGIVAGMIMILILCSTPVYSDEYLKKPENRYGVPQEIIEITEFVLLDKDSVKIAPPVELVQYFRQFNFNIQLLYETFTANIADEKIQKVQEEMKQDWPNIKMITEISKQYGVDYLIFDSEYHRFNVSPAEYGYEFCANIVGFDLYRRTSENEDNS